MILSISLTRGVLFILDEIGNGVATESDKP